MGLNAESLYLRASDREEIGRCASEVLRSWSGVAEAPLGWAAPVSVGTHADGRRKVALSAVRDGWLQLITSDEVIEPWLAIGLSERLSTDVVAVQVYEVAGASGYTHCRSGRILASEWNDHAADPFEGVRAALAPHGVSLSLASFAEAVRSQDQGWLVLPLHGNGDVTSLRGSV